jgi:hypothetical protein
MRWSATAADSNIACWMSSRVLRTTSSFLIPDMPSRTGVWVKTVIVHMSMVNQMSALLCTHLENKQVPVHATLDIDRRRYGSDCVSAGRACRQDSG